MGNIKSAVKRVEIAIRNRKRNSFYKGKIKKLVKDFKSALLKNKEEAQKILKQVISAIDKAALKRIIHKNKAARRKSFLQKLFNSK